MCVVLCVCVCVYGTSTPSNIREHKKRWARSLQVNRKEKEHQFCWFYHFVLFRSIACLKLSEEYTVICQWAKWTSKAVRYRAFKSYSRSVQVTGKYCIIFYTVEKCKAKW